MNRRSTVSECCTAAQISEASADDVVRGSYGSFLERAGLADLSDIESMQLFYRGGVDAQGRPVFLFWAGHLPTRHVDLERVSMHLLRTLDAHVHSGYVIVYVHTTLSPENEPRLAWLRKMYGLFDQRLQDQLHLMFIIHASWWLKMAMNVMRTFVTSGHVWENKVVQLPHLVRISLTLASKSHATCLLRHGSSPDPFVVCPPQADLFKRNYFAPGSLRMPDSPLVLKYLEMSNDADMIDVISSNNKGSRGACASALASAVRAVALPSTGSKAALGAGADAGAGSGTERDATPHAAEVAAVSGMEGKIGIPHSATQVHASKEVLLQQLIELSDQLAQV